MSEDQGLSIVYGRGSDQLQKEFFKKHGMKHDELPPCFGCDQVSVESAGFKRHKELPNVYLCPGCVRAIAKSLKKGQQELEL